MDPRVIFIHIPKTGGTTFQSWLSSQFKKDESLHIAPDNLPKNLSWYFQLPREQKETKRYIRGHIYFGVHAYVPPPYTYITILRDPVERVVSDYFHAKRNPTNPHFSLINGDDLDLVQYLEIDGIFENDNYQTRFISGLEYDCDGRATVVPVGGMNSEIFDRAIANIDEHFGGIGTIEKISDFVNYLNSKYGWNMAVGDKILNRNPDKKSGYRDSISTEALRLIETKNPYDIRLYDYVNRQYL